MGSPQELLTLRERIWEHFERGGEAAPKEADKPGAASSGMCCPFFIFGMRLLILAMCFRRSGSRVSSAILRERFCGKQAGVQPISLPCHFLATMRHC